MEARNGGTGSMLGTRAAPFVVLLIGIDPHRVLLAPLPRRIIGCLVQRSQLYHEADGGTY